MRAATFAAMGRHDGPIVEATHLSVPARRRQVRVAILLAVGVLGAGAILVTLLMPRAEDPTLQSWEEAVVTEQDLPDTVEASGTVVTEDEREVASTEAGTVTLLSVEEGERVSRVQLMLLVGSPELQDELSAERARLAGVERETEREKVDADYQSRKTVLRIEGLARALEAAEADEKRAEQLLAVRAATTSKADQARRATESARRALDEGRVEGEGSAERARIRLRGLEAEREESEAKVARLEERVASLAIRSPMDGTVVEVSTSEGKRVQQHVPLLLVADTDHPSVELRVPESQAAKVEPGQEVALTVASERLAGRVASVGLRAEAASSSQVATVLVRATFDSPPAGLIAGTSVTAEVRTGTKTGALTLPRGPWLGSGEARFVFRIEGGDLARRVPVSVGSARGMEVEILSGLQAGDRVITSGYQEYRDRETVRLAGKGERS